MNNLNNKMIKSSACHARIVELNSIFKFLENLNETPDVSIYSLLNKLKSGEELTSDEEKEVAIFVKNFDHRHPDF